MNFKEMVTELDVAVERFFDLRDNPEEYKHSLHEQIELTQKIYDFITGEDGTPDAETLDKILMEAESEIPGWLLDLPFNLAAHSMVDEAIELSRRYSELFETGNFLGDLAIIYAEAGRKEDALKQAEVNLNRFPEDVWIIIKAGDVYETLNDNGKALELYERAYDMTSTRTYNRDGVLERLVPLLRDMDRDDDADALLEKEKVKPVLSEKTVKIGRNEPCPCGSSKKFKKCCGR
jgi:tetratricopeptide (TPR) repeat protein